MQTNKAMFRRCVMGMAAVLAFAATTGRAMAQGGTIGGAINPSGLAIEFSRYVQLGNFAPDMLQLTFNPASNDDRLYVTAHNGGGATIYAIDRSGASPASSVWLNVDAAIPAMSPWINGAHGGVRSVAFHPAFATNGKFYTSLVQDQSGATPQSQYLGPAPATSWPDSVLFEWTADPQTGVVDTNSARELFRVALNRFDHPIKQINFNPYAGPGDEDYGLLYIAHGDGGLQNAGTGQVGTDALGKLLRIDPLDPDGAGSATYSVPATNPFTTDAAVLDEIFALGFRNPHNFSWTKDSADNVHLILADIGQSHAEEVNIVTAGGNYGWREREGTFVNSSGVISPLVGLDDFFYPVAQFGHDPGQNAITGSSVAPEGSEIAGQYLLANFPQGDPLIYHVSLDDMLAATTEMTTGPGDLAPAVLQSATTYFDHDDDPNTPSVLMPIDDMLELGPDHDGSFRSDLRFGRGPDGEIYLLNKHNGWVYLINSTVPRPCNPGDTDYDGDIDTGDLTTAIINFTGAGGSGKTCADGDTDDDGDVDTGDLTSSIINFTGAQAGSANVPDLVYDPATGRVMIDADGADVISFSLQAGPFDTGAVSFADLPAGLTDNLAVQIGWTSFNLFTGLTGVADLGEILPAGLDAVGLAAALTTADFGLALSGGGGGGRFDLIVPEPGTCLLLVASGLLLARRGQSASKN